MSATIDDLLAGLPTADDVSRWERASVELGQRISELTARKHKVDEFIKRAKLIFDDSPPDEFSESIASKPDSPSLSKRSVAERRDGDERMPKGSWMTVMLDIARRHPGGISYDDARLIMPPELREQLARGNSKAFYGSLRRLERDGKVIRFNSHIFTPKGFEEFKQSEGYGSLSKKGSTKRGSPIGDAVKEFLAKAGPSKAVAIRDHLCEVPEFRTPIKRNSSALYNVLKRLVDRDELIHDRENSVFSLPQENGEALASPVGGAATPPIQTKLEYNL